MTISCLLALVVGSQCYFCIGSLPTLMEGRRLLVEGRPSYDRLWDGVSKQINHECTGEINRIVIRSSGIGSEFHAFSATISRLNGHSYVYDRSVQCDHWRWVPIIPFSCPHCATFDCLFVPPSCTDIVISNNKSTTVYDQRKMKVTIPESADKSALKLLLQPTKKFKEWLTQEYAKFDSVSSQKFNASVISVHWRLGDKITESDFKPFEVYLRQINYIISRHNISNPIIYLSSEDQTALEVFKVKCPYPWFAFPYKRPTFNCAPTNVLDAMINGRKIPKLKLSRHDLRRSCENNHRYSNSTTNSLNSSRIDSGHLKSVENIGLIALLNMYLSLESKYILCDRSSNWCRLLHELSDGNCYSV